MKIPKANFLLPVVFLIILGLFLAVYFIYFARSDGYFAVVNGSPRLEVGDPVYLEQEKAGKVEEVVYAVTDSDRHVIRFSLSHDYSLPMNSSIEIVYSSEGGKGYISIGVEASKDYFQPGDTVFRGSPVALENDEDSSDGKERNLSGDKVVYKIQLMVSSKKIETDDDAFMGMRDIEEMEADGAFKYYSGRLNSLAEAKKLRDSVIELGIKDAFIVPFVGGRRISIQEARDYE